MTQHHRVKCWDGIRLLREDEAPRALPVLTGNSPNLPSRAGVEKVTVLTGQSGNESVRLESVPSIPTPVAAPAPDPKTTKP